MRTDIQFDAEGCVLRGWHYMPDGARGAVPTIVMAHGFSAVKEQYLDSFAVAFAAAGFGVIVFDNRNFGASEGVPRGEIDPIQQIRDYRHAITFAMTLEQVDPERIGIWGTSYSGGHVLVVAAIDRRVRCVVSQVPTISGSVSAQRRTRGDRIEGQTAAFNADRLGRFQGKAPRMIPVVSQDDGAACALPGKEAWAFFMGDQERSAAYRNAVTLRSAEMSREYEPGAWIAQISPTPLLMIVADADWVTPTDLALEAYGRAREPKALTMIPGGHFVPYVARFSAASGAAVAWFRQHLGMPRPHDK